MANKTYIIVSVGIIGLLSAIAIWSYRYPLQYNYYLWILNNTEPGDYLYDKNISIYDRIDIIAPHIIPLLETTYKDLNASRSSRGAAAGGLIKADRELAISIFTSFLDSDNESILEGAIYDLGMAKSARSFDRVVKFAHHPNADVRHVTVSYLGSIKTAESAAILEDIMNNDPEPKVRELAKSDLSFNPYSEGYERK